MDGSQNVTTADIEKRRRRLHARIPPMKDCQGKCWNSCTIVPHSPRELERVREAGGDLWPNMTTEQAQGIRRALDGGMPACPSLAVAVGACRVYDSRPVMCRLWGTAHEMSCEYGCEPEWWLSEEEWQDIIRETGAIERAEAALGDGEK